MKRRQRQRTSRNSRNGRNQRTEIDSDYEESIKTSPVRRSPRKSKPTEKILASRLAHVGSTLPNSWTPEKKTQSTSRSPLVNKTEKRVKRQNSKVRRTPMGGGTGGQIQRTPKKNKGNSFLVRGRNMNLDCYPVDTELYILCKEWSQSTSQKIEFAVEDDKKTYWTSFTPRPLAFPYKEISAKMDEVLSSNVEYSVEDLLLEHVSRAKEIRNRSQEEYIKLLQGAESEMMNQSLVKY